MTTYTRADLAIRVLKDLGLIDARETPDAEDITWVEQTIAAVTGQLANEGVVIWGGSDQVLPEEYLVALSKRIGLDVGPSYGLFSLVDAEMAKPIANVQLKRMSARKPTMSVLDTDYY